MLSLFIVSAIIPSCVVLSVLENCHFARKSQYGCDSLYCLIKANSICQRCCLITLKFPTENESLEVMLHMKKSTGHNDYVFMMSE